MTRRPRDAAAHPLARLHIFQLEFGLGLKTPIAEQHGAMIVDGHGVRHHGFSRFGWGKVQSHRNADDHPLAATSLIGG